MPTILSAKDIAEQSLKKIGRFPSTQSQANASDLQIALRTLEITLQDFFGQSSVTSAWGTIQVPLLSGMNPYQLKFFFNELAKPGIQFVYGAKLVTNDGGFVCDLDVINEEKFFERNQTDTGTPSAVYIAKGPDTANPLMYIHPALGAEVADGTYKVFLHVQTFATALLSKVGAEKLNIRPTFYRWAITRTAYDLGSGTLRYLPEQQLTRYKTDYEEMEAKLSGFDGGENDDQPFTQPWGE